MTTPLQKRRKELGKTLEELAAETGISRQTISTYEKGWKSRPDLAVLEKLADAHGMTLDEYIKAMRDKPE